MSDIHGHCLCGAVRVTCPGEPLAAANCHCTECRRATGAVFATMLFYDRADVEIEGRTNAYSHPSDRGTTMTKHFCPNCGTPVFAESGGRPGMVLIRAGILEETDAVKPGRNVFLSSRIASTPIDPEIQGFDRMPG